jgi:thiamine biosynthesis lipoprotein ApbE
LALGHDRVDRLSEKQLNLLNNALYRLKASKSVFDITLEEIVGQYEIVTEYMSPLSVENAVENYKKRQKMN